MVLEEAGLWHIIKGMINNVLNLNDFIFSALEQQQQDTIIDITMMLWCLWKRRNEKIWDDVEQLPRLSIQQASDFCSKWRQVRTCAETIASGIHDNDVE
jgi:hypothetical protein